MKIQKQGEENKHKIKFIRKLVLYFSLEESRVSKSLYAASILINANTPSLSNFTYSFKLEDKLVSLNA